MSNRDFCTVKLSDFIFIMGYFICLFIPLFIISFIFRDKETVDLIGCFWIIVSIALIVPTEFIWLLVFDYIWDSNTNGLFLKKDLSEATNKLNIKCISEENDDGLYKEEIEDRSGILDL